MKGHVLITDGKIARVIPAGDEISGDGLDEVIDCEGTMVMPGMTNAHYHSYSNLLKGTENKLPLELWSLYTVAYGHSLTDEDIYLAVLLGASEMIRGGVTGCVDHFPHLPRMEAALHAYETSGIQVSFAPMMQDVTDHQFLSLSFPPSIQSKLNQQQPMSVKAMKDLYESLIKRWHGKHDRIHIMLGPNAPQRCSDEMLTLCRELRDQYELKVHTHLLETKMQKQIGDQTYSNGIIGFMEDNGLLTDRLSVAHAVWVTEEERELLKARQVQVIHNPVSNMMLGSGRAPLSNYVKSGITIGLGTDSSNCGTQHNLFEAMRLAAMLPRLNQPDYETWPTPKEALNMATVGGASIMESGSLRGKIKEGYDADLVFLSNNTIPWAPTQDVLSQLVFQETGHSIESVMIKGDWILRNRQILSFDEQEVIDRIKERTEQMMSNSKDALQFADLLKPYVKQFYQDFYQ